MESDGDITCSVGFLGYVTIWFSCYLSVTILFFICLVILNFYRYLNNQYIRVFGSQCLLKLTYFLV